MTAEIELFEAAHAEIENIHKLAAVISADLERHLASLRGSGVGRTSELQATISIDSLMGISDMLTGVSDPLLVVLMQAGEKEE